MCTVNNIFTVEALVAKYRNFVENHTTCDVIGADYDFGYMGSIEYGIEGWADHQLLITLYNDFAGNKADSSIQNCLSKYKDCFWKEALDEEEYAFLLENFKDTVDWIFSKGLHYGSNATENSVNLKKSDVSFIKKAAKNVMAKPGNSVYLENDILGDGAIMFPQCVILCEGKDEETALKKIRLFAFGIQYKNIDKIEQESIDIIISGSGWFPGLDIPYETLYSSLSNNGTMVMHAHPYYLVSMEKEAVSFRKRLVADKAIKSVVKYTEGNLYRYVLLIEKFEHSEVDFQDRMNKLSKEVDIKQVTARILLPGYYFTEKPENGVPLSNLLESYDFMHTDTVSLEQPLVLPQNLGNTFKDADMSQKEVKKAIELGENANTLASTCYNVDFPSVLLYGSTKNIYVGIVSQCKVPYAVIDPIACFIAKEGVDLRYVTSLLFDPIVSKQISAIYLDFYYCNMMVFMSEFLHNIIVPHHESDERDRYLANACLKALSDSQEELRRENVFYQKAVRMRKHALTQSFASMKAMFMALNSYRDRKKGQFSDKELLSKSRGVTVADVFEYLSRGFEDMSIGLEHIADVEYFFQKPEWIDPVKFLNDYFRANRGSWVNFSCIAAWKNDNISKENVYDDKTNRYVIRKGEPLDTFYFPKDALELIINNIVSNAISHGFTDYNRKDYQLRFSWHTEGSSLLIEIANNGTPIPADRDVASLKEYGVSTALHQNGHNGIGCNEIDDIMHRYVGDYEIISTPQEEFTVRYVLSFKRTIILSNYYKRYET